jgi:hypothetical protein
MVELSCEATEGVELACPAAAESAAASDLTVGLAAPEPEDELAPWLDFGAGPPSSLANGSVGAAPDSGAAGAPADALPDPLAVGVVAGALAATGGALVTAGACGADGGSEAVDALRVPDGELPVSRSAANGCDSAG